MDNSLYLFSAFGITWIFLFVYIHSMIRRQKTLESGIEKITEFLEKNQSN
jgi:CcmD family protein